jgi:Fe-S-cluster containining protein
MSHDSSPDLAAVAASLCLECGLCCNGVLFDQVRLQPGDRVKPLEAMGLKVKKRQFFPQPCQALCGTRCTIYGNRPVRCREFACRQFQLVAEGRLAVSQASQKIAGAKDLAARVEQLLQGTAGENRRKPLAQRVATALLVLPEGREALDLQQAMQSLQELLAVHFRVPAKPL